jgi:fumarylacetoacetase
MIDETHDKSRRSWVASANGHAEFPLQNLPLGVFRLKGEGQRGGVAIGEQILDLDAALDAGLFAGEAAQAAEAAAGAILNPLMALRPAERTALRRRLFEILDADGRDAASIKSLAPKLLHNAADCVMALPAEIGDYTDFFAGIHHATNTGRLFRPDAPLLPNYKYVPVAYHGRGSSIQLSGVSVRRPQGQRKPAGDALPSFGPSRNLDYELELGLWIGPGNRQGEPIPIAEASQHLVGLCLLNDWSARDVQAWEYQPLGPFLAKNFATTISPWVVTAEALAPFRKPQAKRGESDPKPLDYLWDEADQRTGAFDIELDAFILTDRMRRKGLPLHRLSHANAMELYWTAAQMVAHHSCGGCNLNPGDLFGSGTISGESRDSWGSLLELTKGGREPIELSNGETRRYLEDGDQIIFRAHCRREGFASIGFGECRGTIAPALEWAPMPRVGLSGSNP